ncbi:MAG: SatD family protein [Methanimicrococcus sp.]|nr:SatD family protein [Methanimicrococcus sp.]
MIYFAIIGDIIKSRNIGDRDMFQKNLYEILSEINSKYSDDLASSFVITLGDEFQGLLKKADHLLEITDKIKFMLDPVEIRFGVGIGEITTAIDFSSSIGADGPAYWYARDAINTIHSNNDYNRSKIMICSQKNQDFMEIINESLKLCDFTESKWRKTQKELIKISILNFGYDTKIPQKKLASLLNIAGSTTNSKIQSTGYYNYLRLKKSICTTLQNHKGEF